MKAIESFVRRMFKAKKISDVDQETMEILIQMLTEKVEDLKEQGMDEADAIDKTIDEFGEIDDYYHPKMDREKRRHRRIKTIRHYRNDLLFAALSTVLIAGILAIVNIMYFWHHGPWFIVPTLGLLFWPLSLLYALLNKKSDSDE